MLENLLPKPQNEKTLRNCGSALYRIAVHCMKLQRNLQCAVVNTVHSRATGVHVRCLHWPPAPLIFSKKCYKYIYCSTDLEITVAISI